MTAPQEVAAIIGVTLVAVTFAAAALIAWLDPDRRPKPAPPPPREPEYVGILIRYDGGWMRHRGYPPPPPIAPVAWDDASALVGAIPPVYGGEPS